MSLEFVNQSAEIGHAKSKFDAVHTRVSSWINRHPDALEDEGELSDESLQNSLIGFSASVDNILDSENIASTVLDLANELDIDDELLEKLDQDDELPESFSLAPDKQEILVQDLVRQIDEQRNELESLLNPLIDRVADGEVG